MKRSKRRYLGWLLTVLVPLLPLVMAYHLTRTNPKNEEDIQVALVDYWMEHQEARIERLRRANAGLTHPAARFFHVKILIGRQKAPTSLLRRLENQHTCVHFYTAQSESHEKYCLSLPALHHVKGYRVRAVVWRISYPDQECERDDFIMTRSLLGWHANIIPPTPNSISTSCW